ncbi:MAG: hypothetical protein M3Z04_18370 [Chloroflexota bacterium]|nr:hypothetical protein [Chloroflexota bacterium]
MEKYRGEPLQVHLRQVQYDELWALAHHRGEPIVELIRQGIDHVLASAPEDISALVQQYAIEPEPWPDGRPIEESPDWAIVNDGPPGTSNAATEHDKYLAEIFEEEQPAYR